jgi:hypothetical protein
LNRAPGLPLDNRGSISDVACDADILDPQAHEVAPAQLAVDGQVEHREVTSAVFDFKPGADRPNVFRP